MAAKATKKSGAALEKLRADIKSGSPENVYIFYGEETYLRDRYLEELKALLVPEGFEEFNYHRLSGKGLTVQDLTEVVEAMPMMAQHTLTVVTDMDLFRLDEGQRGLLINLLRDFPEYGTLVFVYDVLPYKRDGKMKKLCAAIGDHAQEVEVCQQERDQLLRWMKRRFAAEGHDIDTATADHLLFTCGTLMTDLVPEIGKIAAYAKGERITVADINAVADPILGAQVFDMTNSITAGNNGTLRIEATGDAQGSANTTLNVESITFQNGSTTELIYNFNQDAPFGAPMLTAGTITVQEGAGFLLSNMEGNAAMNAGSDLHDVVLMSATGSISGLEDGQSLAARISGLFAVYYQDATLSRDGNDILLNATLRQENLFASAADTWNSATGASLLWEARKNLDPDSQLAQFMNGVSTMINDGNLSGASRAMAAAAGSTVNALGTAQRDALRDQMGWIRNRTTLMGVNPAYVNDDLPRFHMWMEGTGSYAKLDTRGDESGYQLTTWGGTVGMDADLSDRLTVGAAFTAGYGDLTLAGHVHSMQLKIRPWGRGWSPAKWIYKHWSGRYDTGRHTLYVNDGTGYVAYPMRLGAWPEVTLFTLKRCR